MHFSHFTVTRSGKDGENKWVLSLDLKAENDVDREDVLELLAFLDKIFGGHVRTVAGNMCVKFEVCSFNRFGAISI